LSFKLFDQIPYDDLANEPQAWQTLDKDGVVEVTRTEFFDVGLFHAVTGSFLNAIL
jgi:hypothetical protein